MPMKHKRQNNYINLSKSKPKQNGQLKKRITPFIDLVLHEIIDIKTKKVKNPPKIHPVKWGLEAMKHLAKRRDIIITTADKGGAVVIMDTKNYIKEVNRELSDKNNYIILQIEPTLQHNKMVNDTLDRFKNENLLSKKATGLKIINRKTPKFYYKPKLRKESNPGRPVINSTNCHTSEISRFLDYHFQSLVKEVPSLRKLIGAIHFLQICDWFVLDIEFVFKIE